MEFHEDLFPDTAGCVPASKPHTWWAGSNQQVGPSLGWSLLAATSPCKPSWQQPHPSMAPQSSCILTQLPCVPHPYLPLNCCLSPQVQRVSLNPAHRPYPSFTSCLVLPADPSPESPDSAQPSELPVGDEDPSVSASGRPGGLFNLANLSITKKCMKHK